MKKLILPVTFLLMAATAVKAQTVEIEKTYELSKKTSKGTLLNASFDGSKYTLLYVTKGGFLKPAMFEIYDFDKDFNFISKTEDQLDFTQAKQKYSKAFSKRGANTPESFTRKWAWAGSNMFGTLEIETYASTYTWNWEAGGYVKNTVLLDKFKPKSEEGSKYRLIGQFTDGVSGDLICLVTYQQKIFDKEGKNGALDVADTKLIRINMNGEIVKEKVIDNKYISSLVIQRTYSIPDPDNDEETITKGCTFILAPTNVWGKKLTQYENPNKAEFTYLQVNGNLDIEVNKTFVVPNPVWRIDDVISADDTQNEVYLYGPAAEGKDAFWGDAIAGVKKFQAVQLAKFSKGEMKYISNTNLDDMEKNYMQPPTQKKSPEYRGRKFEILSYRIMPNSDFLIVGQNFEMKKDKNNNDYKKYTDVIVFHFDKDGRMKANYGIDKLTKSDAGELVQMPTNMFLGEKDGSSYFLMREIDGIGKGNRILTYARLGKITLNDKGITDLKLIGGVKEEPQYFLDENFPYLSSDADHKIVFFGADKKGKNIWFSRVKLD
jgi:hypothetical protein